MLTVEQKRAIIGYITGWSTKPVFEDVRAVYEAYDAIEDTQDEVKDEFWEEVESFLSECGDALEKWFENEHCKKV